MATTRSPENPIITPDDIVASRPDFEVIGAFNAGSIEVDGEVLLLIRVAERPVQTNPDVCVAPVCDHRTGDVRQLEFAVTDPEVDLSDSRLIRYQGRTYLTSLSHLRLARSRDGVDFAIDPRPTIFPETAYEEFGIEDPRITRIGETFYITFSCISARGICTGLVTTSDFRTFSREGIIFHPDNKDVVIFPAKIGDAYYALHRPSTSEFGNKDIWIAESPDLRCWGNHRHVAGVRPDTWDSARIGGNTVPFLTDEGWIEIYHGANEQHEYHLGVLLLDRDEPWKVRARSRQPIMSPEAEYETSGFFDNVVFPCGAIQRGETLTLYYGASDCYLAVADIPMADIRRSLGMRT